MKLSKSESKKAEKKLNRALHTITRRCNVEISMDPTRFILISNAGLVCENSSEELVSLFSPFGPIERIVMPIGESFSFLEFRLEDDAARARERVHGSTAWREIDRPLYLSYVSRVPEMESDCDFLPSGLTVLKDVVDESIETTFLSLIGWEDDENDRVLKNRRVKHYGYEFRYDTNNVDVDRPLDRPIPSECCKLLERLIDRGSISSMPDQLTVNEYRPGHGIPSHVDTHSAFRDEILSLSLGSDVVMDFKHPNGKQTSVQLPRRSLLIMTSESRYLWSHGITPRKTDVVRDRVNGSGLTLSYRGVRTSFTFRTVRRGKCSCNYAEKCDSQQPLPHSTKDTIVGPIPTEEVSKLESEHVHKVYDVIADHFSNTRHTPWPRVEQFVNSLSIGTLLLDVGCGNGKYLALNEAAYKIGCDRSSNLMSICSQRGFQGFCCDALRVPVRSDSFDACLCIAVIHHFATPERRIDAVRELSRVLRVGGKALIYVWALEQRSDETDSNYIKTSKEKSQETNRSSESNCNLPVHTNRTSFESQDLLVPWHLKSKSSRQRTDESNGDVYHRYYHMFRNGELEEMCATVSSLTIVDSYYDKGNWCIILEKYQ